MNGFMDDSIQGWIVRLGHRYSAANFREIHDLGIHPGQLPILHIVYKHEGISQKELAEQLHIKPPTVAVSIKRMEKAGIIIKEEDPEDKRISRIYLSKQGKDILIRMNDHIEENERMLTQGFSDKELELLKSYYARMIDNLKACCADNCDISPCDIQDVIKEDCHD